ncbi:predicted protein [Chaetoceros tenuissimus]|uniref:Uncharacterized protein n=1 Tax=Chaetoceros tenuissimus TaxID=426638 RepID=A0AAD3HCU8_9STRA|nr:predicted protein [Chaetoceros tenuissimus]
MLLMVEVEERLHLVPEEDSPELEAEDEQNQNPNWCQISSYFLMTKIEKRCYFATEEYSSRLESEEEEKLRIIPEEEAIRLMAKD